MVTGDNQTAALAVARDMGIDHVQAQTLPGRFRGLYIIFNYT
jgi:cation transport ATPase